MIDYLISQLPGLGVGGVFVYLAPGLWKKLKAKIENWATRQPGD
jgi:hypothetical protein